MCNDSAPGYGISSFSCPVGRYASSGSCSLCTSGKYGFGNSTTCRDCAVGKYNPFDGSSVCFECPKHFYSSITGSSACTECPAFNKTDSNGSTSISACNPQQCTNTSYIDAFGRIQYLSPLQSAKRYFRALLECQDLFHGGSLLNPIDSSGLVTLNSSVYPLWLGTYRLGSQFVNINGSIPISNSSFSVNFTDSPNVTSGLFVTMMSPSTVSLRTENQSAAYYCQMSKSSCIPLCFPGTILSLGRECQVCSGGKYSSQVNQSSCLDCAAGYYSNVNSSSCSLCQAGSYASSAGQSLCSSCSQGSYQDTSGQIYCKTCPIGSYCAEIGLNLPKKCAMGLFQNESGASSCRLCDSYSFSNITGMSFCYQCPYGSKNIVKGSFNPICPICQQGFYGLPTQPASNCTLCSLSDGVRCPENSSLPFVLPGYYRVSLDNPSFVFRCQPMSSCEFTGHEVQTLCGIGYTEISCSQCSENYYRQDGFCRQCPGLAQKVFTFLVFLFAAVGIVYRVSDPKTRFPPDAKVALKAMQTIALFPRITSKWPPEVLGLIQLYSISV
jgi:hypothetical protein